MVAFVWCVFYLSLLLMIYAVYRTIKHKAELQLPYIGGEDFWMWAAIRVNFCELFAFLRERKGLVLENVGNYYEVNCVKWNRPITDSVVLPVKLEKQCDIIVPVVKLEEIAITLGIKPQEVLHYIAVLR